MSDRPTRKIAPIVALLSAALLAGLFWVLASGGDSTDDKVGIIDSHLLDDPAPAVKSTTLDGQPFDLSRRKGSWVVLNFFNSTCGPCKAEHPELVKFNEDQAILGTSAAEFYTVLQLDDEIADVESFFAEGGGDWPIVRDDDGSINVAFGVAQVPETFIIDPNGVVRLRWAGMVDAVTLANLVQQQRQLYGDA